jgi:PEP-CTERM motif-containing protein
MRMVKLAVFALFSAVLLLPSIARADNIVSTLGTGNSDISGYTTWTVSNLAGVAASFNTNGFSLSDAGSGNVDGFGVFNQTFDNFDGYAWALTQISFTLTDTSGTWADAAAVLGLNASGYDAAAHIAVCDTTTNSTCATDPGAAATGFAAEIPTENKVPEPATLAMMGGGLIGLGGLVRRFRKR